MSSKSFVRLFQGVTLAALAASLCQPVHARQTAADDPDTALYADLDDTIIVTANRREQSVSDVLASVDVLTSEDIAAFSGASITEVLRQAAGVDARTSGANSTIAVRGQIPNAGSAVLVLVDGLPRTGKFGVVNLNTYPVEDVERVEIIRGPLSALYGANASGGVINLITKPAGFGSPLSMRVTGGLSLNGDGEGRETLSVGASRHFRTGPVGHRVSVDWRSADPYRFDGSVGVDDLSGIDHISLTYSGAMSTGETGQLRWALEGYDQNDRAASVTRTGTTFERFEREQRLFGSLAYNVEWGRGLLELEGSHGVSDGTVNRSFPGPDETTDFTQSLLQGRYILPIGDHTFLAGVGVQLDEIDVSILTQVGEETNLFAFLQDEWLITEEVKLVAGLRLDDFDAFGTQIVPRLSIGSQGRGFTWRAGYGEAFRAPSVLEQFSRFNRGRFLIVGSPEIDPEETEAWEAAIGWRGTRANIEIVYHDSQITNLIQASPDGSVENGLTVFRYQNIQAADISGVEIAGELDLGRGFGIEASYDYLDAEDGSTDERLVGRARHAVKAGLTWDTEAWRTALRVRHTDGLWGIDPDNRRRPAFASDYTVVDAQIRRDLSDSVALSVGLDNIFDERTPPNWSSTGAIEDPAGRFGYVTLTYTMGDRS